MATKPSGTAVPRHGAPPFPRAEFCAIRLSRDPEEAYAAVCRILAEHRARPDVALDLCLDWLDGFGVESLSLVDGSELLYVNKGDTYDATLCYMQGRGCFVASSGDVYEDADREHEEESGERRCAYCSEWAEQGGPCGSCGRDPETGYPVPEPLRHVRQLGYTLRTWDTGRTAGNGRMARTRIGYELRDPAGTVLFRGDDFRPGAATADDSDEALRALLGFLTLRPGDTDREYFADYSAAQQAFTASSDCELLQYLYSEEGPGTFADCVCDVCGDPMDEPLPEGWRCKDCQRDVGDEGMDDDSETCRCADCQRAYGPQGAPKHWMHGGGA